MKPQVLTGKEEPGKGCLGRYEISVGGLLDAISLVEASVVFENLQAREPHRCVGYHLLRISRTKAQKFQNISFRLIKVDHEGIIEENGTALLRHAPRLHKAVDGEDVRAVLKPCKSL